MTLKELSDFKLMIHDNKLAVIEVYLDKGIVQLRYLNLFVTSQNPNSYFEPTILTIDEINDQLNNNQDCFLIQNNNKVYQNVLEDLGVEFPTDTDEKEDE